MCDIKRQLAKLHVTPQLPPGVTPLQKLHDKLYGFYFSDPFTPVIGPLSSRFMGMMKDETPVDYGLRNYFHTESNDDRYPNRPGDWMYDELELAIPDFDMNLFADWLNEAGERAFREKDMSLYLSPPLCVPNKQVATEVKRPVVVHGDIVLPKAISEAKSDVTFGSFDKPPTCRHITDGNCPYGDKCIHLLDGKRCYGERCNFVHKSKRSATKSD